MTTQITLTQAEIDAIGQAVAKSTAKEQQDALASREAFLKWLRSWGLGFIANKVADWALSQLKTLWNRVFG